MKMNRKNRQVLSVAGKAERPSVSACFITFSLCLQAWDRA